MKNKPTTAGSNSNALQDEPGLNRITPASDRGCLWPWICVQVKGEYTQMAQLQSTNTEVIFAVYDFAGKVDLSKGYWNPKRKLGVTTHFLEIIKATITCILKSSKIQSNVWRFFSQIEALIYYLWKMHGYPQFSF